MDGKLVECVPNFSEGRSKKIIDSITDAMLSVEGIKLLDVDMGFDFNRTVVTIVGEPDKVLQSVLLGTGVALDSIDMSKHTGEHSRMGAVDVVPFIPIRNTSMDECIELAERFAVEASKQFNLSVYLYAEAATHPSRVKLPDIRRGQYEGLEEKMSLPEWQPDHGPSNFNPKFGVTASGARPVLIAFNVNLDTDDKSITNHIAGKIRTSGIIKLDEKGEKMYDDEANPIRIPGQFKSLQAAGWMYDDKTAQVSMNLLNYEETGLHHVFDTISQLALETGNLITAGELVGLVPLNAILEAGTHYSNTDINNDELIQIAIGNLKLDVLGDFIVDNRIIEFAAGV